MEPTGYILKKQQVPCSGLRSRIRSSSGNINIIINSNSNSNSSNNNNNNNNNNNTFSQWNKKVFGSFLT